MSASIGLGEAIQDAGLGDAALVYRRQDPAGLTDPRRMAACAPPLVESDRRCRYPGCGTSLTVGQCVICDEHVCLRHEEKHAGFVRRYAATPDQEPQREQPQPVIESPDSAPERDGDGL
jgi:hypothetical protein